MKSISFKSISYIFLVTDDFLFLLFMILSKVYFMNDNLGRVSFVIRVHTNCI
jgi:hypothetical protein